MDNLGNSHEIVKSIIPDYKNHTYLPKIECAKKIANHIDIDKNTSHSFNATISAIKYLIEEVA